MSTHVQRITLTYDYPVYFTRDVFAPDNADLVEAISRREPERRHRVLVVVERAVADARPRTLEEVHGYAARHHERLTLVAEPLVVEGGEAVKNDPDEVRRLQERLNALGMDRQSFVVVVGGGALLDMAGYAAATAHRGVRVVRVPTTVLAQDDAGVGVKNGINMFGKKNFLGTFAPPFAVLNDAAFLDTLSTRDKVAGMAEAVKVALIRDAAFFDWLVSHAGELAACAPEALDHLIRRSARLHLDHIATSGDPFELGSARPLDFGHWAAHKLESLSSYRLRHGEAVAIGMALDAIYSARAGLLQDDVLEPVLRLLERLGLSLWDETLELVGAGGRPRILDGLTEFREHLGGELSITFLAKIGWGIEAHSVSEDLVLEAMEALRHRARGR